MPPYLLLAFASLGAGGSAQSRYDEAVAAATSSAIAAGEEPPVVVSVSRIRGPDGQPYLVDKSSGIAYSNDITDPQEIGTWTAEDGIAFAPLLPKEAAEAADDYSSHTGDAASSGEGSKEENSDCGCDATKREAGQTKMKDDDAEAREARYSEALNRATGGEDPRTAALVQASGGWFTMGSDAGFFPEDAEGPTWKVKISPFLIGKHEISNQRFADFVAATGYKTEAELFGNSFVVEQFVSKELSSKIESAVAAAPWWIPVDGSDWLHPEGPDSNLTSRGDRWDHPAVHVSYNDALAFCQMASLTSVPEWFLLQWSTKGGRLPTEAEWEYAASGGQSGRHFPWGDTAYPDGRHLMNTWQSSIEDRFLKDKNVFKHSYLPTRDGHTFFSSPNTAKDGFKLTAPVGSYPPNALGLHNTVGNVWEWTSDWKAEPGQPDRRFYSNIDPKGPPTGTNKVKKGGSFMCHQFTCYRYRVAARMFITPDSSASNVGFRCAADLPVE